MPCHAMQISKQIALEVGVLFSALHTTCDVPAGKEDHEPDWGSHERGAGVVFEGQYDDHEREESENNPAHEHAAWHLELRRCVALWELTAEYQVSGENKAPHHHEQHGRNRGDKDRKSTRLNSSHVS